MENVIQYYTLEEAEKIIDFRRSLESQRRKRRAQEACGKMALGLLLIGIGIVTPMLIGDGTATIILVPMGLCVVFGKMKEH